MKYFCCSFNSSPIDELTNWCHERLVGVGGPTEIYGIAGRFPWQTCEQEPALQVATNQQCHPEGTSVEILTPKMDGKG